MSSIDFSAHKRPMFIEDSILVSPQYCKSFQISMDTERATKAGSYSVTLPPASRIHFQVEGKADAV